MREWGVDEMRRVHCSSRLAIAVWSGGGDVCVGVWGYFNWVGHRLSFLGLC